MQRKVDFDLLLDTPLSTSEIKVGQEVTLQEQDGSWLCSLGSQALGAVPPQAASDLRSHTNVKATIRSLKRSSDDPNVVSSVQVRLNFLPAEQPQPLAQAEAPAEDPAGFTLTTTELERLAYNEDVRTTLKDTRLQQLLLKIDGAANREQALKQALELPQFREFADTMLSIMKPSQYPAS
eukprot:GHUV01005981.1.p1 GENE.GHUV01005981.1~~GHUV01005981.1.p1  ORF type:complete len:180 (+),score=37.87 GHUV01005981.1:185-724(+)